MLHAVRGRRMRTRITWFGYRAAAGHADAVRAHLEKTRFLAGLLLGQFTSCLSRSRRASSGDVQIPAGLSCKLVKSGMTAHHACRHESARDLGPPCAGHAREGRIHRTSRLLRVSPVHGSLRSCRQAALRRRARRKIQKVLLKPTSGRSIFLPVSVEVCGWAQCGLGYQLYAVAM